MGDKCIYKGVMVVYALVCMAIEGPRKKWVPKALRDPIALGVVDQASVVDTPPTEVIPDPEGVGVVAAPTVGEEGLKPEAVVEDKIPNNEELAAPADPVISTPETDGVEQHGEGPIDATEAPPPIDATEVPPQAEAAETPSAALAEIAPTGTESLAAAEKNLNAARTKFVDESVKKETARRESRTWWEGLKEKLGAEPHKIRGDKWNKQGYRDAATAYRAAEKEVGEHLLYKIYKTTLDETPGGAQERQEAVLLIRKTFIEQVVKEDKKFKAALSSNKSPSKHKGTIRKLLTTYGKQPKSVRYTLAFTLAGVATLGIGVYGAGFSLGLAGYAGYRGIRAAGGAILTHAATEEYGRRRGKTIEQKYNEDIKAVQARLEIENLENAAEEVRAAITKQALQNKHLGWQKMLLATTLGGATALGSIYADPHFFPQGGAKAPVDMPREVARAPVSAPPTPDSLRVPNAETPSAIATPPEPTALETPPTETPTSPETTPASTPTRATFLGDTKVHPGNTTWSIIKEQLRSNDPAFSKLSGAQQNFVIDAYKDSLQALKPEELKKMGFASGNIDRIFVNNNIDLTFLNDTKLSDNIYTSAGNLTTAEQANIMNYGKPNVPGTVLTPAPVEVATLPPKPSGTVTYGAEQLIPGSPLATDLMLERWASNNIGPGNLTDLIQGRRGMDSTAWQSIQKLPAETIVRFSPDAALSTYAISEHVFEGLQKTLRAFSIKTELPLTTTSVETLIRAGIAR